MRWVESHVHTHTHTYRHVHAHIGHTHTHTHNTHTITHSTHTDTHTHAYTQTHTHTLTHTHIHTYTHTYRYTCTHAHTHTHVYWYVHVHVHTHTYTLFSLLLIFPLLHSGAEYTTRALWRQAWCHQFYGTSIITNNLDLTILVSSTPIHQTNFVLCTRQKKKALELGARGFMGSISTIVQIVVWSTVHLSLQ